MIMGSGGDIHTILLTVLPLSELSPTGFKSLRSSTLKICLYPAMATSVAGSCSCSMIFVLIAEYSRSFWAELAVTVCAVSFGHFVGGTLPNASTYCPSVSQLM